MVLFELVIINTTTEFKVKLILAILLAFATDFLIDQIKYKF